MTPKQKLINYKKNYGFTLIELMIAISILSLLLFTGSYSYSIISERWNKELGNYSKSSNDIKNLERTQRLLEGIQPFVVVDSKSKPSFFFIGDKDSLLAVSRAGLFSNEFPEVFRFTSIKNKNNLFDLVYQSRSTEGFLLLGTEQSIEFTNQITLFENLDSIVFNYFGWSSITVKNFSSNEGQQPKWFDKFSGIDNQLMPDKIIISLVREESTLSFPIFLESDSEHWLSPYLSEN